MRLQDIAWLTKLIQPVRGGAAYFGGSGSRSKGLGLRARHGKRGDGRGVPPAGLAAQSGRRESRLSTILRVVLAAYSRRAATAAAT